MRRVGVKLQHGKVGGVAGRGRWLARIYNPSASRLFFSPHKFQRDLSAHSRSHSIDDRTRRKPSTLGHRAVAWRARRERQRVSSPIAECQIMTASAANAMRCGSTWHLTRTRWRGPGRDGWIRKDKEGGGEEKKHAHTSVRSFVRCPNC